MSWWSRPHAGRRSVASLFGPWGAVAGALALAMGAAIALGTANTDVPRSVGFAIGAVVACLTVAGLPSFPTHLAVYAVLASGGFVLLRHAGRPGADARLVVLFLVAAIATVVLTERVSADSEPALGARPPVWRGMARVLSAVLGIVVVLGLLLAPLVAAAMHQDVRHGDTSDAASDPVSTSMLSFSDTMDTTVRPRLSKRVVMTVEADRPSFWRGTTYDTWDGRTWRRSGSIIPSSLLPQPGGWQAVFPAPEDPAPENGVASRQTFTMRAPFAAQLFAAPTPVRVRADRPVSQLDDATIVVRDGDAMGAGTTYTVESRIPNATAAGLAAAPDGPIPRNVAEVDLAAPPVTDRVRELAHSIVVDAGAHTPHEKVQAIMAWLGSHTEYSLDAPLPPRDTNDAVDHFVFVSRQGWCEQIASALTVMLRLEGVPARVATGFATGESDALTGRYTVRERDAHAWTEVYFPGIGWQGFDPTSRVPLAGEPPPSRTLAEWLRAHVIQAVVLLVVLVALAIAYVTLRPVFARRRARVRRMRSSWAAGALLRLEAIGRKHARPRADGETPRGYGAAVAAKLGEPGLAAVGDAIDRGGFGPPGALDASEQDRCDAVLAAASSRK